MAEVESYLLQRQQQVLERRAVARSSPYQALGATLLAIVAFSFGQYAFGAVCLGFAALCVSPAISRIWKRLKGELVGSAAEHLKATLPTNLFPSPEALFDRASDHDRRLLIVPTPRVVHIMPRKGVMAAIPFAIGFCGLFLWVSFHQAKRDGHLRPSVSNAPMMVFAVFLSAAILIRLFHHLWKARRLLVRGQAALGLVIIKTEEGGGMGGKRTTLWYDFREAAGRIRTDSCWDSGRLYSRLPSAGSVIVVFHDPDKPEQQIAYCMSPYEVVLPGAGHAKNAHQKHGRQGRERPAAK
jgi:hypothetical protein